MCISTPKYNTQPVETPTAQPTTISGTNNDTGAAMLNQYMERQRQRGQQSTVRSGTTTSNTGLTTGGSANNTTLG